MLNDYTKYTILNLGVGGRTMMKDGDYPYWNEPQYKTAMSSEANTVILMLGTNDAKTYQWNEAKYKADFIEMATGFINMDSKPRLYVMVPPPLYKDGSYSMS